MPIRRPPASAPRPAWVAYARDLALLAIAYNVFESLVAMAFGWADRSVALFGFGADSLIEVGSSMLVLWRLQAEQGASAPAGTGRERRTALGVGILFLLLALGTAAGSALQLAARRHPGSTLPGLGVAILSAGVMVLLWRGKKAAARALDSQALAGDATCSLVCLQLSLVLFLGSLAYGFRPSLWWADAAAALVLSAFIGREGWEMVAAARKPDFKGGCGCHG